MKNDTLHLGKQQGMCAWLGCSRRAAANTHIAEGLIWASLCAAVLKRFHAHPAPRVGQGTAMSTRRVAMCAQHILDVTECPLCPARRLSRRDSGLFSPRHSGRHVRPGDLAGPADRPRRKGGCPQIRVAGILRRWRASVGCGPHGDCVRRHAPRAKRAADGRRWPPATLEPHPCEATSIARATRFTPCIRYVTATCRPDIVASPAAPSCAPLIRVSSV